MGIYVIGYLGSDRVGFATKLSHERNYEFLDMDKEIEKRYGNSIKHLCMSMGEHEYRNKEYELLVEVSKKEKIVVACGDGVILDNMSFDLLKGNHVVFLEEDLNLLWEKAKNNNNIPYAFMHTLPDEEKHKKFLEIYKLREHLYRNLVEEKK